MTDLTTTITGHINPEALDHFAGYGDPQRHLIQTFPTGDKLHMSGLLDGRTFHGRVEYLEVVQDLSERQRAELLAIAEQIGLRVVFAREEGDS